MREVPPDPRPGPRGSLRTGRILLAAAGLALVVGAAVLVGPGDRLAAGGDDPATEVALPEPEGVAPGRPLAAVGVRSGAEAFDPSGELGDARDGPTCNRPGCALWVSTSLDQRPLLYADGVLVHLGGSRLVRVDPETGDWLWDVPHSDPRGIRPAAAFSAVHVDGLAIVIAYGTRVRVHDPETGFITADLDLTALNIGSVTRHDGTLVLTGRSRGEARTAVLGIGEDGDIRWRRDVDEVVHRGHDGGPLLVREVDELLRLDGSTGGATWLRELGPDDRVTVDGELVVVDDTTGAVRWLDTRDGRVVLDVQVDDVRRAMVRDDLLVVAAGGSLQVFEQDGTQVDRVTHPRAAEAEVTRAPGAVVVAFPAVEDADQVAEIQLWDRSRREAPVVVPIPAPRGGGAWPRPAVEDRAAPPPVQLERAGTDQVRAVVAGGAIQALVDVRVGRLISTTVYARADRAAARVDDLTFVLESGSKLTIHGPDRSVAPLRVTRATQVASTSPLLVHGGAGTLLLDRTVLERERSAAP